MKKRAQLERDVDKIAEKDDEAMEKKPSMPSSSPKLLKFSTEIAEILHLKFRLLPASAWA